MNNSQVIQVLFADDNPDKVQGVTKLLHFEPDIHVVGQAGTVTEALEMAERLKPDVVLMDPRLPPSNGFGATRDLVKANPRVKVIMLSMENDPEAVRGAMRAGAVDYIWDYIKDDRLVRAIREAGVNQEPPPPPATLPEEEGKLIAVFTPRGGAGVTTLAVNLALALNTKEVPAVLVDADLQFGDVCAFLNLQPRVTIVDIAGHAEGLDEDMIRDVLLFHESGLPVVAAPVAPELADEVSLAGFLGVLQALRRSFGYVVVGAGSYLSEIILNVLEEADVVVSVVLPDIPSIKDARLLLDLFFKLDLPREKLALVMNKMSKNDKINLDKVSESLSHPIMAQIPFDLTAVQGAINRGKPLMTDEKARALRLPLLELAGKLKEQLLTVETEEA